jgi:hypothetical protein
MQLSTPYMQSVALSMNRAELMIFNMNLGVIVCTWRLRRECLCVCSESGNPSTRARQLWEREINDQRLRTHARMPPPLPVSLNSCFRLLKRLKHHTHKQTYCLVMDVPGAAFALTQADRARGFLKSKTLLQIGQYCEEMSLLPKMRKCNKNGCGREIVLTERVKRGTIRPRWGCHARGCNGDPTAVDGRELFSYNRQSQSSRPAHDNAPCSIMGLETPNNRCRGMIKE